MLVLSHLWFPQSDNLVLNTPSVAGKPNKDAICDLCLRLFHRKNPIIPWELGVERCKIKSLGFLDRTLSQVLVLFHLIVHMKKRRQYLSGPTS